MGHNKSSCRDDCGCGNPNDFDRPCEAVPEGEIFECVSVLQSLVLELGESQRRRNLRLKPILSQMPSNSNSEDKKIPSVQLNWVEDYTM